VDEFKSLLGTRWFGVGSTCTIARAEDFRFQQPRWNLGTRANPFRSRGSRRLRCHAVSRRERANPPRRPCGETAVHSRRHSLHTMRSKSVMDSPKWRERSISKRECARDSASPRPAWLLWLLHQPDRMAVRAFSTSHRKKLVRLCINQHSATVFVRGHQVWSYRRQFGSGR